LSKEGTKPGKHPIVPTEDELKRLLQDSPTKSFTWDKNANGEYIFKPSTSLSFEDLERSANGVDVKFGPIGKGVTVKSEQLSAGTKMAIDRLNKAARAVPPAPKEPEPPPDPAALAKARETLTIRVVDVITDWTLRSKITWVEHRSVATTRFLATPSLPKVGAVDFEIECSGGLGAPAVPELLRIKSSFQASKVEVLCTGILKHRLGQLVEVIALREAKRAEQRALGELDWLTTIAQTLEVR
jgi:hypothetical protein